MLFAAWLSFGHPVGTAQANLPPTLTISRSGFEVIGSKYFPETKIIFVSVFVAERASKKKKMLRFSNQADDFHSKDKIDGLVLFFYVDRESAQKCFNLDCKGDKAALLSVRGVYAKGRESTKPTFDYYPSGTTPEPTYTRIPVRPF